MPDYKKTVSAFLAALFAVTAVSSAAMAAPAAPAAPAPVAGTASPVLDPSDKLPTLTDIASFVYDIQLEENMLEADAAEFGQDSLPVDPEQAAADPAIDQLAPIGSDLWLADLGPAIDPNSIDWSAADATEAGDNTTQATPELMYSSTRAQRVIAHARTHMGDPYRFGANGPSVWDCSSFVRHVYGQVGIYLPRTSLYQSRRGTAVSKANLRPGDIVFFKDTWRAGVSHVGIYIGNHKMIHAWPGAGVTIGDMTRPYFVSHYWGARRVL